MPVRQNNAMMWSMFPGRRAMMPAAAPKRQKWHAPALGCWFSATPAKWPRLSERSPGRSRRRGFGTSEWANQARGFSSIFTLNKRFTIRLSRCATTCCRSRVHPLRLAASVATSAVSEEALVGTHLNQARCEATGALDLRSARYSGPQGTEGAASS